MCQVYFYLSLTSYFALSSDVYRETRLVSYSLALYEAWFHGFIEFERIPRVVISELQITSEMGNAMYAQVRAINARWKPYSATLNNRKIAIDIN